MRPLNVLVACEYSGRVRSAFRALGHNAWSCDLLKSEDNSEWHITGDVRDVLSLRWDLLIGHPPCTYMANSGAKHLYNGMKKENGINAERMKKLHEAALFFKLLWSQDVPYIALENPVMMGHAKKIIGVEPTHSVQPWQFGHMEVKRTCLWLKSLPKLKPTHNVYDDMMKLGYGERAKVHYASPGPDRWKERSRTYTGVAEAMATQWSEYILANMAGEMQAA